MRTGRARRAAQPLPEHLTQRLQSVTAKVDHNCGAGASAKFWGEGYDLNSNYDTGVSDLPREWAAECAAANTTESHVNELMTSTAIDFRREASGEAAECPPPSREAFALGSGAGWLRPHHLPQVESVELVSRFGAHARSVVRSGCRFLRCYGYRRVILDDHLRTLGGPGRGVVFASL